MEQELRTGRVALGRQLSDLRRAAGLTQQQLAIATFTSRSSIACIETGRQNPDRTFWHRADEATGAAGALTAGYGNLRMLTGWQASCGAAMAVGPFGAETSNGGMRPSGRGTLAGPALDIRTMLAPYSADDARATHPAGRGAAQRRPAFTGEHRTADPGRAGPTLLPAERSHELFIRGYALLGANDRREFEAAKVLLDRAVMREPLFAQAIAARGYASWRQYFAGWASHSQALASAMSDIHAALTADPDSVLAHLTFIRVCWDMGWHETALAAGRRVFDCHPDSLNAALAFARALNNAGLSQFALPLVDSILTADPTSPAALRLRIWCHLMVGNFGHTVGGAADYLPAHPADANTRWAAALACCYLPAGGGEALRIVEDAATADPSDITAWVLLGYLRRHLHGEAAAAEGWKAGLAYVDGRGISNNRVRAWLANLYAALGEEQKALAIVDDLRSREPGNGYLCYRLAHVLAELRRDDQAVDMLDQAMRCGFLSVQLARREEVLATTRISASERYCATMRRLEQRVAACAAAYAYDILPVPVAATASARWSNR
jgi:tetratricopeptide (TPR) repeat protein/DNA-binding XRE family transcriptional regulator